MLRLIFNTFLS